jgi:hypothetical protein
MKVEVVFYWWGDILHSVEFNEAFEKIWIIENGKRVGNKESFTSLEIIIGTGRNI